jgi:hypothetical protein
MTSDGIFLVLLDKVWGNFYGNKYERYINNPLIFMNASIL